MSLPAFPTVDWERHRATFFPAGEPLPADAPVSAALVFARHGAGFVVANIEGRGWCIPSGRLEAGETPEQAARREAWEEAGATLNSLHLLGHFLLTEFVTGAVVVAAAFVGNVTRLDALPSHTESRGVRVLTLEELPESYYRWDELLDAVFRYSLRPTPCASA
ncbi:MAG TPA: NUDIX domain-containing protein [Chthonomonadaceae bacterium]|nr:NUDIX domain-containing protein [Chthonomonadaceae bacterium]